MAQIIYSGRHFSLDSLGFPLASMGRSLTIDLDPVTPHCRSHNMTRRCRDYLLRLLYWHVTVDAVVSYLVTHALELATTFHSMAGETAP
jgi:hypothetical protein